ncbi:MAG: outer membrane protein assembly factor BamD [Pseudomonadota bacterium]|jgi:outer membrane protein assembly factor BamD|nr:outer membrane protein assembly factor BamD [Pseudomonadota bacterium]MEC7999729.1 outer membrane protein assembly factor BamD [Pseudomonadota bacterium]|tara:strand:+ start:3357 stop:4193 length:837 start_codon:yes stop_codon:yes gene_type:complete
MFNNKLFQLTLILALSFFNSSCSKDEVEIERPEKVYYDQAQRRIKVNNYYGAIESLQKIETQYPFGKYAEQAQVELIYCQYMNGDDIAAHAASERFIRLHPRHPNIDYAYFMKGMSSYTRDSGTLARVINTDLSTRDISGAKLAFSEFTEFLTRFPDSQYAPYAKKRLVYIRNLVAKNELAAADYYIKRKAYVAAIRRANYVIENIPNSSQNHRALQILKVSYQELGYDDLVASTDELLRLNPAPPETDEDSSFFERIPLPNSLPVIIAGSILSNAIN